MPRVPSKMHSRFAKKGSSLQKLLWTKSNFLRDQGLNKRERIAQQLSCEIPISGKAGQKRGNLKLEIGSLVADVGPVCQEHGLAVLHDGWIHIVEPFVI